MSSTISDNSTWRAEIDGLRTVAVMAVIIYHARIAWGDTIALSGGYLGVDVFFVISGYLITGILTKEYAATGTISISKFYQRRFRRLIPALVTVIVVSIPFALFILLPSQLITFSNSILASLFFVSNFYWYDALGAYEADSALLQPFLNTWSLAVEEHFYIFFPLAYLALLNGLRPNADIKRLFAVLIAVFFAISVVTTNWKPDFSFYLSTSRVWELLAGAWLAIAMQDGKPVFGGKFSGQFMPELGLLMVLIPMVFGGIIINHPGAGTILCVIGTALIIGFAHPESSVTKLLSNQVFVFVGLISYSLYLWHYPVFAFGRHLNAVPAVVDKTVWILITFLFSFVSYRYIETPFRRKGLFAWQTVAKYSLTAILLVAFFSASVLAGGGFPDRFKSDAARYAGNHVDPSDAKKEAWSVLLGLAGQNGYPSKGTNARFPSEFETDHLWFEDEDKTNFLIIGNSHSRDLFNMIHLNQESFHSVEAARIGIAPDIPIAHIDKVLASKNFQAADVVALAFRYNPDTLKNLPALIESIQSQPGDRELWIVLNNTEFYPIDGKHIFQWYMENTEGPINRDDVNKLAYEQVKTDRKANVDAELEQIAEKYGLRTVSRSSFVCNQDEKYCLMITPDNLATYIDSGHLTLAGARFFGAMLANEKWFEAFAD